jgi:hypothetical protein
MLRIIAIDPSTDITGVALMDVDIDTGAVQVVEVHAYDATAACGKRTTLEARCKRIARTREWLGEYVTGLQKSDAAPHVVGYETDSGRGHMASEALAWATGNLVCVPSLAGLRVEYVTRLAACYESGAGGVYREPKGATAAEALAKRERLKAAVIAGVNARFGLALLPEDDAKADAVAVGMVVCKRLRKEEWSKRTKAAQKRLKLRKAAPSCP